MKKNIQHIDPKLLFKNKFKEGIYDRKPANYEEIKSNIFSFGILEPLIIETGTQNVISGNLRLDIALELSLDLVPIIYSDKNKDIEVISTNQQRKKSLVEISKEFDFINDFFKIKKGQRTDLNPLLANVKKDREAFLKTIPKDTKVKLAAVKKMLKEIEPKKSDEKLIRALSGIDNGKGSLNMLFKTTREKYKRHLNEKNIPDDFELHREDIHIFKGCSTKMHQLEDQSIDTIVTSPPYFDMKAYFSGNDERGKEATVDLFIENLTTHFIECLRVLKDNGNLFVNINDNVDNGRYNLVNHKFVLAMCNNGYKLNDEYIWIKHNSNYTFGNRSVRSHEYIYHFVKEGCDSINFTSDWLMKEVDEYGVFKLGKTSHKPKLLSGFDCRLGILKTNGANNSGFAKLCAQYGIELTHHATFPEILPYIFLKSTTNPGQSVLDPFNGTGTAGKVAKDLGLKYYGYELNPHFIKTSEIRIFHDEKEETEFIEAA